MNLAEGFMILFVCPLLAFTGCYFISASAKEMWKDRKVAHRSTQFICALLIIFGVFIAVSSVVMATAAYNDIDYRKSCEAIGGQVAGIGSRTCLKTEQIYP